MGAGGKGNKARRPPCVTAPSLVIDCMGSPTEDAPMNVALHSRITQAAEGLPRRRFTVTEVEAMIAAGIMDEDERVELIGGELVPMSPKGNQHEALKIRLVDRWSRHRPLTCIVAQETTFRLS